MSMPALRTTKSLSSSLWDATEHSIYIYQDSKTLPTLELWTIMIWAEIERTKHVALLGNIVPINIFNPVPTKSKIRSE